MTSESGKLSLMNDLSEVISYDEVGIPLYIRSGALSSYPGLRAPCHWHDDIEWIHILTGSMRYHINKHTILLTEGDSLMVNARQMHDGFSNMGQDCTFSCVLFNPLLLINNSRLQQRCIYPITQNPSIEYIHFHAEDSIGKQVGALLCRIQDLKAQYPHAHAFKAVMLLYTLWDLLLDNPELFPSSILPMPQDDLNAQKDMVTFIYHHYPDKIFLNDIATAGHVSRSKCCRLFRQYLKQTPVEFLNDYRLKASCQFLLNTDASVTEIAFACGFQHSSYYSKLFYEAFGCTPRSYRQQNPPSAN